MTNSPGSPVAGYPSTPPTAAGPLPAPPKASGWAGVIGTIAIVLGVLGMLGGLWGLASPALTRAWVANLPPEQLAAMDLSLRWSAWTETYGLLATTLAVLLLAGGVGLARRRPWSIKTLTTWALLKILLSVVSTILGWTIQQEMWEAMQTGNPALASGVRGWATGFALFVLLVGLVWACALPVFVLIWFARATIRAQVAEWGPAPATP
jgi:hypothetical protein